jgi:hypothetical protein
MNGKRNWIYGIACVLVYGFLAAAAVGSYSNIVGLAHDLGVSSGHAWTTPFLVDGIALMGKLLRSRDLAPTAHRAGLRLMIFGGVLSLAANVLHGHTWGDRIYGALLVVGFIVVERASDHLAPAPAVKVASPELKAKRSAAAVKAAATRKRNAAAKKATRTPKVPANVAGMEKEWRQVAPLSPAVP